MSSAENSVSEPSNLKIFWGRIPPDLPTSGVPLALARVPLLYKKPSYGPVRYKMCSSVSFVTHTAIALERYRAIVKSMMKKISVTVTKAVTCVTRFSCYVSAALPIAVISRTEAVTQQSGFLHNTFSYNDFSPSVRSVSPCRIHHFADSFSNLGLFSHKQGS